MQYSFKGKIYKVGINPCVKVPPTITDKLEKRNGYIRIKGTINDHYFEQTLCPVKGEPFRLYVNGIMLKGGGTQPGKIARFVVEQNRPAEKESLPVPALLDQALKKGSLKKQFDALTAYRKKEILGYLSKLKTNESLQRNVNKIVLMLSKH